MTVKCRACMNDPCVCDLLRDQIEKALELHRASGMSLTEALQVVNAVELRDPLELE